MKDFLLKINLKAVLIALFVALVLETILQSAVGVYIGVELAKTQPNLSMQELSVIVNQQLFQQPYISMLIAIGLAGSILAGFITIWIAKKEFLENIIGLILIALIINFTFLPAMKDFPMWAIAISFISVPPFMYLGGVIGRRKFMP